MTSACAAAGLTVASVYAHRARWPGFRARWDRVLEDAMVDIECALIDAAENFLAGPVDEIEVLPIRCMTAVEAAHILLLTDKIRRGEVRWRPGPPREPPIEAARAAILSRIAAIERGEKAGAARREAFAREVGKRRG